MVVTAVVTTLVSGAFALGGVALGRQGERRHWLRQERLAAYTDLLATYGLSIELRWLYTQVKGSDAWEEGEAEYLAKVMVFIQQVAHATARVRLLGPANMARLATEFEAQIIETVRATPPDDRQAKKRLDDLRGRIEAAASDHFRATR